MADFQDEDDLFKESAMTFGEHLEELRSSLFKAVICLAIGTCVGLYFGTDIVKFIQSPLKTALTEFYSQEAIEYVNLRVPPEMQNDKAIQDLVLIDGLEPKIVYLDPRDVFAQLKQQYPEQFSSIDLPQASPPPKLPEDATKEERKAHANLPPWISKDRLIKTFEWRPIAEDDRIKPVTLNVQEGFIIWFKAGLLFGAIVSSPFALYFLWSFVAAGLYPHEKKYVHRYLPFSLGLFLLGAALAFGFVFPQVLSFFFAVGKSMDQVTQPRISEWLGFVLLLPLAFGVSFQLPLVMLFLDRIGVFGVQVFISKWRIAVLVLAILAMVLSPGGDPNTMMLMFIPLVGLYFGGIALCKYLPKRDSGVQDEASEIEPVAAGR